MRAEVELVCSECGCHAEDEAAGWRAYRDDLPEQGEPPSPALFCPVCAAREFDGAVKAGDNDEADGARG